MIKIGFKRLTDDAILPTKAHVSDSGFDLYANEDIEIKPGETKVIKTGIAAHLPNGHEAQVRPRSGVTSKSKLRVQLGAIDEGYCGEIGIIVDNAETRTTIFGKHPDGSMCREIKQKYGRYKIQKGDKLAQLVVQALPQITACEVDSIPEKDRGNNGFGSTGYSEVST